MRYARCDIVSAIQGKAKNDCRKSVKEQYGIEIKMDSKISDVCIEDDSGDQLDSILCALQAAWAYQNRERGYGIPRNDVCTTEGWIVDPEFYPRV